MTNDTDSAKPEGCSRVPGDRLADLRDGLLSGEEQRAVEEHLAACPDCAARARDVESLVTALTAEDVDVSVPPAVDERIRLMARDAAAQAGQASRASRPARPPRLLRWAAAACLLLGVFAGGLVLGRSDLLNREQRKRARHQAETLMQARQQARRLLAELSSLKADTDARIGSLRAELDGALGRNVSLAEAVKKAGGVETRLRKQVASLTAEVSTQGKEVDRLGRTLERLATQGKDMAKAAMQKHEETVTFYDKVLKRERERSARLAAEVRERRAETARLEARVARLEAGPGPRGDFNGDGRTDVVDAMAICDRLTRGGAVDYAERADLNGDGKVDVGDALLIAGLTVSEKGQ